MKKILIVLATFTLIGSGLGNTQVNAAEPAKVSAVEVKNHILEGAKALHAKVEALSKDAGPKVKAAAEKAHKVVDQLQAAATVGFAKNAATLGKLVAGLTSKVMTHVKEATTQAGKTAEAKITHLINSAKTEG